MPLVEGTVLEAEREPLPAVALLQRAGEQQAWAMRLILGKLAGLRNQASYDRD